MIGNEKPSAKPTAQFSEDAQASVRVSDDNSKAFITLTEPKGEGKPVSVQLIMDALNSFGVVHGINENTINALVKHPKYNWQETVAEATFPVKGDDAKIIYLFTITSEAKPKELPNGSVDFKNLDLVKNVRVGDVLCTKTPATEGVPGTSVMGAVLEPKPGKNVQIPAGQNTVLSEDGLQLTAKIDGQVDLIKNRVTVLNVFDIKENIDYKTGNIDFVGNINVGGDVSAGFSVRAEGNVYIKGTVDGGVVEAGGNITVVNGINGQANGKVVCGGSLSCKYLQNANVEVGKNLETTSCINSVARVGENVKFYGAKAVLLSSRIVAGQSVEAFNIGSPGSKVGNIIEVGVNPRTTERAAQITNEINLLDKNIESVERIITLFNQLEEQNRLPEEKKVERVKLMTTLKHSQQKLHQLELEKDEIEQKLKSVGSGTVKALGTAFAGTVIAIGADKKQLVTDYQFTQFTRNQDGIQISPAK